MTDLLRVSVEEHLALSTHVLTGLGVPEAAAREQAELLLEGDLRGHASHGLRRLDMLAQRLRSGAVRASARPTSTWTTASVLVVDGDGGLGPPVARRAVEELLNKVAETGVAVAAVRNANHLGMLAPYVESMAAAGVIGLALTTSEALVHPWGGTRAMVGTNPLAVAVPVPGEDPVVLDMATGQVSRGKVLDHAARGLPLAPGDAVDSAGVPTDPSTKGDLFIAMDPSAFGSGQAPVAEYLGALRATPPASGHERVLLPGDRSRATRATNLVDGVPVSHVTWARAQQIAADVPERH